MQKKKSNEVIRIFISHSWHDKEVVRRLEIELKTAGAEVWVDHSDVRIGDKITNRVENAFRWCNFVLLLWSKSASESEWVEAEWSAAFHSKKIKIIPCTIDDQPLPFLLRNIRSIELIDFKHGITTLLNDLGLGPTSQNETQPELNDSKVIGKADESVTIESSEIVSRAQSNLTSREHAFVRAELIDHMHKKLQIRRLLAICLDCLIFVQNLESSSQTELEMSVLDSFQFHLNRMRRKALKMAYSEEEIDSVQSAIIDYFHEVMLYSLTHDSSNRITQSLAEAILKLRKDKSDFISRVESLLEKPEAKVEILEVYYLCLILGCSGRYRSQPKTYLRALIEELHRELLSHEFGDSV